MNPFSGTWVANIEKSRHHTNHQFQSATLSFEISGDDVSLRTPGSPCLGSVNPAQPCSIRRTGTSRVPQAMLPKHQLRRPRGWKSYGEGGSVRVIRPLTVAKNVTQPPPGMRKS
jgi:hypothetical protein